MLASSRGLRDGKTEIFEFLLLRQHDDSRLVLAAIPFGRNATEFSATQVEEASAVFENAENDFPQRISYRRVDDQRLQARIEIAQDDPKQAMRFPMHRVACGGPGFSAAVPTETTTTCDGLPLALVCGASYKAAAGR